MAEMSRSMQATCVRPTTAVKQVVNQQQSTAAVQITITSAISAIAYMRDLLPVDYFVTQYIGDSTSPLDYDRFVQDGNGNHPRATQGSLVYMLKRGVSERADSLYDTLVSFPVLQSPQSGMQSETDSVCFRRTVSSMLYAKMPFRQFVSSSQPMSTGRTRFLKPMIYPSYPHLPPKKCHDITWAKTPRCPRLKTCKAVSEGRFKSFTLH